MGRVIFKNKKIFCGIIGGIKIYMMNYLLYVEKSMKVLFCNISGFLYVPTHGFVGMRVAENIGYSLLKGYSSSLPRWVFISRHLFSKARTFLSPTRFCITLSRTVNGINRGVFGKGHSAYRASVLYFFFFLGFKSTFWGTKLCSSALNIVRRNLKSLTTYLTRSIDRHNNILSFFCFEGNIKIIGVEV